VVRGQLNLGLNYLAQGLLHDAACWRQQEESGSMQRPF